MLMNPKAYMGGHYNYDDLIRKEEAIKWNWFEKEKIDDEEEWEENYEEIDSVDDDQIVSGELEEPLSMEEQCKA